MPRFIVMVKASKNSEAGVMPTTEMFQEMMAFNEKLVKAGVMESGEGLQASAKGKRIHFSADGKTRTVVDGPFPETKELVAGFWVWKCKSMEEAVNWARQCPAPMPAEESDIEIRQIMGPEDFGDALTPELQEQEDRLRDMAAKKK